MFKIGIIIYIITLITIHCVSAQEYYLPCENGKDTEKCSIITDGYYAIKREIEHFYDMYHKN